MINTKLRLVKVGPKETYKIKDNNTQDKQIIEAYTWFLKDLNKY